MTTEQAAPAELQYGVRWAGNGQDEKRDSRTAAECLAELYPGRCVVVARTVSYSGWSESLVPAAVEKGRDDAN
jgi:hypothetical protein